MAIKRDQGGKFERGSSGGPGRPRDGITNALRRLHDPEEIATFLLGVIRNGAKLKDRIKCAELVLDRLEGKAVTTSTMTVNAGASLPPGWASMTAIQRIEYLDRLELALPAPAVPMLAAATMLDELDDEDGDE